jgi:tRNA threonylcarbamoyl adenosine modification protein (Sua5/YciO/YrdC/YwlC family)
VERIEVASYYLEKAPLESAAALLRQGGLVIVPTDTVYGLACDPGNKQAVEKLCRAVGKKPASALLSLLCADFRQITDYTLPLAGSVFRLLKSHLPGPYTFILPAASRVEKSFHSKRKTIGFRIPEHPVCLALIEAFDGPLMVTSLHSDDHILDYENDPDAISAHPPGMADLLIDSGLCGIEPSTVIDCSGAEPVLIRAGKGIWP